MGAHDKYGKDLLHRVLGRRFDSWDSRRNVRLGSIGISLDGIITAPESSEVICAVEIEAENETQIRGAVLNLSLHPAPKALLVLMSRHLANPVPDVLDHVQKLWTRLTGGSRGELAVASLVGDGHAPAWDTDEGLLTDSRIIE